MDSQKVYHSIVELLYNVVKNDKLKYWILRDLEYRQQAVTLVNDLITLEKEHDAKYKDEQWSTTFAKAIVIITDTKLRFERLNDRSVEKMYQDYSDFIAYSNKNFDTNRLELEHNNLPFTSETVLLDARITPQKVAHYDEEELKKKEAKLKEEESRKKTEEYNQQQWGAAGAGANAGQTQADQQAYNQAENMFESVMQNMPQPPTQDPRFYPYKTKPKWMPTFKIVLGVIVIISAIILIAANAWASATTFTLSDSLDKIGNAQLQEAMMKWHLNDVQNGQIVQGTKTIADINNVKFHLDTTQGTGFMMVFTYILYAIPAIYLGFICFSKPKNTIQKYRVGYGALIFTIIFFAITIVQIYHYANPHELQSTWDKFFNKYFDKSDGYSTTLVNEWWNGMEDVYPVKGICAFMDVALAFLSLTIVMCLVTCFLNPKQDRQKIALANAEYQRAVMAAYQGHKYNMSPELFDDEDGAVLRPKSKFSLWLESKFKKKPKTPKEDNSKSDNDSDDKKDKNK
ncbi:hypothetical protein [Mesoplasma lactucae]|uniref:Uncharacterized protein n=1 Tax=Mesoplasma lactucae ATCC 49193 TaxID=81460 RepID=A0A291IR89_9MOLU|nr:hypothetical protein [Mesoplasma lactucae]ATG97382.1 hypothetical protein CP520_01240 [Mesoplasma lactucae ATCC 49193]ATZ20165.1 hypothetical protein MLACT_v1c03440 [Mesoplasma lactucae ATCC 49193]MCL8216914.1 hypothetical protein [Mesoplasma lactucae ATCC 49193]